MREELGWGEVEAFKFITNWSDIEEQFKKLQEQAFPRGLRANEYREIAEFNAGILDRAEVAHTERLHHLFLS